MAGAMRKARLYLGLAEEDPRYEGYDDYDEEPQGAPVRPVRGAHLAEVDADDERHGEKHGDRYDRAEAERAERPEREHRAEVTHLPRRVPMSQVVSDVEGSGVNRITTIHPRTYNEAKNIGETFRDGHPGDHEPHRPGRRRRQAAGRLRRRPGVRPAGAPSSGSPTRCSCSRRPTSRSPRRTGSPPRTTRSCSIRADRPRGPTGGVGPRRVAPGRSTRPVSRPPTRPVRAAARDGAVARPGSAAGRAHPSSGRRPVAFVGGAGLAHTCRHANRS